MITEKELHDMYWNEGMTQREIGKVCGVSNVTVSRWIKEYGIKTRTGSESKMMGVLIPSKSELMEMYLDQNMSMNEIAISVGVSLFSISTWMTQYKIKARTTSKSLLINTLMPSKSELEEMYIGKGMTLKEIGKEIGVSSATVGLWMNGYVIETRTLFDFVGENANAWKGGLSYEPYCIKFNNKFKESIRRRDDYICQLCGHEQLLGGIKLSVHHIHYDKENCYPDVVALCNSCNSRVNGNRDYWEQYFEDLLIGRGLFYWSMP